MASRVVEYYGHAPLTPESAALAAINSCPFVEGPCTKLDRNGVALGACALQQANADEAVICCPNRLYADNYRILKDVALEAFGPGRTLVQANAVSNLVRRGEITGNEVVVFGQRWTGELSIPQPRGGDDEAQSFYIDWILALLDENGELSEFTALEVQTIDTTGSYNQAIAAYRDGRPYVDARGREPGWSTAGFNWANVSKRILPQLIYKGYVLRREARCTRGLFFICPSAVLRKVRSRLGGNLLDYPIASGTITFRTYDLGPEGDAPRQLVFNETFTTTVEQMAYAFVSPVNLPEMGVYENAIRRALAR